MTSEIALWEGLAPGSVPRGYAERALSVITEVSDVEFLWTGAAAFSGLAQKWNGHGAEKAEIKSAQMFCEIQLGQLLGPNPGAGGIAERDQKGRIVKVPNQNADSGIPPSWVTHFRRYHGFREPLIEAVRDGKRSRRSLLLLVDKWTMDSNPAPALSALDIRGGDFRSALAGGIEPGTVALVLTDPPYATEYLPLWDALGEWSSEALVEGGSLVAYCGQSILPQALERLGGHLRYWWTIAVIHGQSQMIPGKWVSAGWKPALWFVRGNRSSNAMLADTVKGGTPRKTQPTGDDGTWAQSVDPLLPIISALTAPGDLIVDPFAGSGTVGLAATRLGRCFIGADVNA